MYSTCKDVPDTTFTKYSNIIMYAVDTVLYVASEKLSDIEAMLAEDINVLTDWLENNQLVINLKKMDGFWDGETFVERGKSVAINCNYHYILYKII